jgi:hypothetical protein
VPPMRIRHIVWGGNAPYATRRATIEEIEEVLLDHRSDFRRNLTGRAATHIAKGRTRDRRPLVVAFIYAPASRSAKPINAWEDS